MFAFDNSYARLPAGFYQRIAPEAAPDPQLIFLNQSLIQSLGLTLPEDEAVLTAWFSGQVLPPGAQPIAQAYAGHQFGHFNPQLGDGRAHLLGEILDPQGQRWDIALKGSGRTAYSRRGDGKAALGPMLREVLMGEAMHALGISSARALAVVTTGQPVYREQALPGAVLCRLARSHLRIGTFQYFAAQGQYDAVRQLVAYSLERHDPDLLNHPWPALALLQAVARRQASLIAQWMHAGFIHGVMNTDNASIAGETIDYGPCAFMEHYDPEAAFSSIDEQGRYAYAAQPRIAQWNLARLAEALLPLLGPTEQTALEQAEQTVQDFATEYEAAWFAQLRNKLGLGELEQEQASDRTLGKDWLKLLQRQRVDYTQAWYALTQYAEITLSTMAPASTPAGCDTLHALFAEPAELETWLQRWQQRRALEGQAVEERLAAMRRSNPRIIPRNHQVEAALQAAQQEVDLVPFERLLKAVRQPYARDPVLEPFATPAPASFTANYCTFCGT